MIVLTFHWMYTVSVEMKVEGQYHSEGESDAEQETAMSEPEKSYSGISWRVIATGLTTDNSSELPLQKTEKTK